MKTCPYCHKENDDSVDICSCGYYFSNQKYQENKKESEKKEVIEKKRSKKIKIIAFIIPILGLFIYKVCTDYYNNPKYFKLDYEINENYIQQSNNTFYNAIDNAQTEYDKNKVKKVVNYSQGVLYFKESNSNEQVIVFEYPISIIKKEADVNSYLDNLMNTMSNNNSKLEFTQPKRGQTLINNKHKTYYLNTLIKYPDGDKRYSLYYILKIKNKYYQVIVNTYDINNKLEKVIKIIDKK